MAKPEADRKKGGRLRRIIKAIGVLLLFGFGLYLIFPTEMRALFDQVLYVYFRGRGKPVSPPAGEATLGAIIFLGTNFLVGLLLFLIVYFLISQAVLPLSRDQRWRAFIYAINPLESHAAPILFVREGKASNRPSDPKVRPKLAMVDVESAIIFEKPFMPEPGQSPGAPPATQPPNPGTRLARVAGPGLTFIRQGERIRSIVSLRKQFRMSGPVRSLTSDGIELETSVFVGFTLSQPANILPLTYVGHAPDDLRAIQIDESSGQIKDLVDELDADDKNQVRRYVLEYRNDPNRQTAWLTKADKGELPPFHTDQNRLLRAAFAQAQKVDDKSLDQWTDYPLQVAIQILRNAIAQKTYDWLFLPSEPGEFPLLEKFKPGFGRDVRNQGILSYQFVERRDGNFAEKGQFLDSHNFFISPVQSLGLPENHPAGGAPGAVASKILRERGIKVLFAGFTELKPTDPKITRQRLDLWRAEWQQKTGLAQAEIDRLVILERNRARQEAERALVLKLSDVLKSTPHTQEALALRVFQALETVATDPETSRLLPEETIELLSKLGILLLPDEYLPAHSDG